MLVKTTVFAIREAEFLVKKTTVCAIREAGQLAKTTISDVRWGEGKFQNLVWKFARSESSNFLNKLIKKNIRSGEGRQKTVLASPLELSFSIILLLYKILPELACDALSPSGH